MFELPFSAPHGTEAGLTEMFSGQNRRAAPRRRVMWRAEADGAPCGVRDLNEGGARIFVPSTQALEGALTLTIRHRRADYPAAVVWRQGPAVGLRFVAPPPI